jgi:hypothetical protein
MNPEKTRQDPATKVAKANQREDVSGPMTTGSDPAPRGAEPRRDTEGAGRRDARPPQKPSEPTPKQENL